MSMFETAEERADSRFRSDAASDPFAHIALPDGLRGSAPGTVDMDRRPDGGEVPGMRATMDRFTKQLIDNGNDPSTSRRIAREQAHRMECRLGRPKRST